MPKRSLTRMCPKFRLLLPRTLPRGLREAADRWVASVIKILNLQLERVKGIEPSSSAWKAA
jgi:hypothetical protein